MSQLPGSAAMPLAGASVSASPSEKSATLPASDGSSNLSVPAPGPAPKLRSCVVCRTRKVRCDKLSPCSNCRRANIACIFPSTDRPPRWARRLERVSQIAASNAQATQDPDPAAAVVMERLRNLESLVKELRGQLEEQAHTAASSAADGSSGVNSPESTGHDRDTDQRSDASPNANAGKLQKQFGRLVLKDANRSRYVGSGFWSRVNDELDGLKFDSRGLGDDESDTSDDEASPGKSLSTQELDRTPSERHGFMFRHNLSSSTPDLREFHPLPSQIPFILDIFSENVNSIVRVVDVAAVTKMVRDLRGSDTTGLTPANEALMFAIYYATVASMDEDDIVTNFGSTKSDLSLKYRLGLEHALAKADFLNVPDLVLIQAFTIFLFLLRLHESPRFVWMMTGLAIRMGQALGLHRDGAHFGHMTPYEIEMRRRVWWALCCLDVRASEDQGTEYTIARGSFDTKIPLNINDAEIEPSTSQMPKERVGLTDMSFTLTSFLICDVSRQMMAQSALEDAPGIEEQSRLLNGLYQKLDQLYFRHVRGGDLVYWIGDMVVRVVIAKLTLFIYLPILFSSPSEQLTIEIRNKLLVAAIELAEYNHALHEEEASRHWRWVWKTFIHWHAIIYLLIEASRRPWSPIIERAWAALRSPWLIPPRPHQDKNLRVWLSLRKLTVKTRRHRDAEIERLRGDPQAADRLEMEDQRIPVPSSSGPFSAESNAAEIFRQRWRQLLAMPEGPSYDTQTHGQPGRGVISPSARSTYTQPSDSSLSTYGVDSSGSTTAFDPAYLGGGGQQTGQNPSNSASLGIPPAITMDGAGDFTMGQTTGPLYNDVSAYPTSWSMNTGFLPWLFDSVDPPVDVFPNADMDVPDINMDLDGDIDWYNWVESAKGMGLDAAPSGNWPA